MNSPLSWLNTIMRARKKERQKQNKTKQNKTKQNKTKKHCWLRGLCEDKYRSLRKISRKDARECPVDVKLYYQREFLDGT